MTILKRTKTVLSSLFVAALLALASLLSPLMPNAHALAGWDILDMTIANSEVPCRLFRSNPQLGPQALYAQTRNALQRFFPTKNVTYNDALRVSELSIITYCPQYHFLAPAANARMYGPGIMGIPVRSREIPLLVANVDGNGPGACNILRGQGIDAAIRFLSKPDPNRMPYGGVVTYDEAKLGLLVTAISYCPDQTDAVRGFLGV